MTPRPGNADLQVGTARRRRAAGKDPEFRGGSPLGPTPPCRVTPRPGNADLQVGTARRRRAAGKDPEFRGGSSLGSTPPWRVTPRPGNADLQVGTARRGRAAGKDPEFGGGSPLGRDPGVQRHPDGCVVHASRGASRSGADLEVDVPYCAEETAPPNTLSPVDGDVPHPPTGCAPHPPKPPPPHSRRPLQSSPAAGAWLSLAEHLVRDQGVAGSNPAAPTRPVPTDGFRPRGGHGVRLFRTHFSPPLPTREGGGHFGTHPWLKTCIFPRSCRRRLSRRVPFFLLLLLDIPESGVMELARMFALSAPAHSSVSVCSEPYFAGFLPLDPVAHILAARLAGAGTRRFALSYQRWE